MSNKSNEEIERLLGEVSGKLSEVKNLMKKEKKVIHLRRIVLELADENFRIDSSDWKETTNEQGIVCLKNLEEDIWEYVSGVERELIGEQLFTWRAAIRETGKAGKRIPTDKEFNQFNKEDFGKIVYTGYRGTDNYFFNLSTVIFFWSSSVSGGAAWRRNLSSDRATVHRNASSKSNGFSVRCLRD
jgi:hypothetical protein